MSDPRTPGTGGYVGTVLAVVSAVLATVVIAGLVWYLVAGRGGTTPVAGPATFTARAQDGGGGSTADGVAQPTGGASSGTGSGTGAGAGASSGTTGSGDVGLPAGLDRSGWAGVSAARCAGTDTWVYAAQNSGARVVVCRDGGDR